MQEIKIGTNEAGQRLDKFLASALLVAAMPCGLNTIIFPKNKAK